jgi:hypothetical protein
LAIWRVRIACWIPKATNTDLEYVTLITFPLQQNERASMLRYTYVHCLSCLILLSEGNQRTSHGRIVVLGLGSARTV